MAIQRHGGMPRQCGADGDRIWRRIERTEQNREYSTAKSIERARVMCEWRKSCGAGTVRRLLALAVRSHTAPHTTNLYFIVAFKIARRTILPAPRLNLRLSGYLGMFRRLFNTRPWVATGRLLCWGGGGGKIF